SAENQWDLAGFQGLEYEVSLLGAGCSDFLQIFRVRIAFLLLLRNSDSNVPPVFNNMPDLLEPRFEPRNANCRWSHVNTAARLTEIERDTDDTNFPASDACGSCSRDHHESLSIFLGRLGVPCNSEILQPASHLSSGFGSAHGPSVLAAPDLTVSVC